MILIIMELSFHCEKRISTILKHKTTFALMCFVTKTNWLFQSTIQIDLLLVTVENNSYYVYIKDFNRFMFHKTKNNNKKHFCKNCLQCFSNKNLLTEHKEISLSINGTQPVFWAIAFKNYDKQIPVPFKILLMLSLRLMLRLIETYKGFYSKKYQGHIPCSFAYKLACV